MGRLRWSGWDGEYKYTPDAKEVERAQQRARFRQDMSRISGDAADSVGDSFTGAAKTTAAAGGLFGLWLFRKPSRRYKAQAVLHFFFVWFVLDLLVYPALPPGVRDAVGTNGAFWVALVWTAAYVWLRTLPKLRRLRGQA